MVVSPSRCAPSAEFAVGPRTSRLSLGPISLSCIVCRFRFVATVLVSTVVSRGLILGVKELIHFESWSEVNLSVVEKIL